MKPFQRYAEFYDRLYADKPYAEEAQFVHRLLQAHRPTGNRVLDAGCGTGRHACAMLDLGYEVTGMEPSREMLAIARQRRFDLPRARRERLELVQGSLQSYRSNHPYDAVTALFHVISYQASDQQLAEALRGVAANLVTGGLFVFDFWFAPGVLQDPPVTRSRRIEDGDFTGTRRSTPSHDPGHRQVSVDIELDLVERASGARHRIRETHLMRYFDLDEMRSALGEAGLTMLEATQWLHRHRPRERDWYACVVARRDRP